MEIAGWKPLDLVVGGMLAAGVALGVYKFGRLGKRAAAGMGAGLVAEIDATNLQECIALAGRPSELEVAVLPQPDLRCRRLAASLRQTMQETRASTSHNSSSSVRAHNPTSDLGLAPQAESYPRTLRSIFRQLYAETKREIRNLFDLNGHTASPPDPSPPSRCRYCSDPCYSPVMVDSRTPPELARQLQNYRDTLDKWTADSEAKMEKIEQERMSLATELRVTREALQTERRHRAEAEQRRQRAEAHLQELETKLQKCLQTKDKVSQREEEMQKLEQQVQEMEEQLEQLYMHNVVTPRSAMHNNVIHQQQLSQKLEEAQSELETQQFDLQEMENEVTNLSTQLTKMRKDTRQLSEENTMLQKHMHASQQAGRQLVALLYERSAGKENDLSELMELLNAPDSDIPLDKLLELVTNLLMHS